MSSRRQPRTGPHRPLLHASAATAVLLATLIVSAAAASAFWSTTGSGNAAGATRSLGRPTGVTVPATAVSTVPVSWTAPAAPGSGGTVAYYVARTAGTTTTAACGTSAMSTTTATSCTDAPPAAGTYTYTVTAVFNSWTAASLPSGQVTVSMLSAPTVTLDAPTGGSTLTTTTPTFSGTASGSSAVTVSVYSGGGTSGSLIATLAATPVAGSGGSYTYSVAVPGGSPLAFGTYTAVASQTNAAGTGSSAADTFTVTGVTMANPGSNVRGTTTLNAALTNPGSGTVSVKIQYAPAGTTTWTTVCTSSTSPYTCPWNTTVPGDGSYDLRAQATDTLANVATSTSVTGVRVDNTAPSVAMNDPGSPLSGTATLSATATDAGSGVAQVVIQYASTGTTTWTTTCTLTSPSSGATYSCPFDTTRLSYGGYDFRATATDVVGNSTTSSTVKNRLVDNTVDSVSVVDPGANLTGTVAVSATATAASGIASVTIQYAPTGTSTWTTLCADTSSPYQCSWNTTSVADGLYDLRATLLDGGGRQTTSATVSQRRVDNTPPSGVDVQATNGGSTVGKLENGDSVTFTYSEQMSLTSFASGWTGSSRTVAVRVRDGGILGLASADDTLDVYTTTGLTTPVNLGSLDLHGDVVTSSKTVVFNATMTAGTVTVGGVTKTTVTVTLGSLASGSTGYLGTETAAANMVWTPSAGAQDLVAHPCATSPVTETGTLDKDF